MTENQAQGYARIVIAMIIHLMVMLVVALLFTIIWNKWLSYEFNLNYIKYTTSVGIIFLYKGLTIIAKGSKYE